MIDIIDQKIIANRYKVIEKLGLGDIAKVYKVKDLNTDTIYAAKIYRKKYINYFEKETNMLNHIKDPLIINLIDKGEGPITKNGIITSQEKYIILEYAEKGTLFDYIHIPEKGFGEKYAKVIFRKILKGILECHKNNVCHGDIKMENILLDNNFNLKICDFRFDAENQGKDGSRLLRTHLGTLAYQAPEILLNKEYDGVKADIFSLGQLLFNIVTGKYGFELAHAKNQKYRLINKKENNYNKYWKLVANQITEQLSQEFKDLFVKMVSYKPKDRISIIDILDKDPWLKEIRELNVEQLSVLEAEIKNEFEKREVILLEKLSEKMQTNGQNNDDDIEENDRGVGDEEYFTADLKLKKEKTGLNMKDFVKIEGEISPCKFMNALANMIKNDNECSIEEDRKTFKFLVNFDNKEEESEKENLEEIPEELEEMEYEANLSIQVKLFQSYDSAYLVRFMKKSGDMAAFFKNVMKIKEEIKKII